MIALDTNILVYAAMQGEDARHAAAIDIQARLIDRTIVIPTQVLGELYNVLVRKAAMPSSRAAALALELTAGCVLIAADAEDMQEALVLASTHSLQIWDALILVVSAHAGCALLLSEDMQDGFVYREMIVANPFADKPHPLLASMLESAP